MVVLLEVTMRGYLVLAILILVLSLFAGACGDDGDDGCDCDCDAAAGDELTADEICDFFEECFEKYTDWDYETPRDVCMFAAGESPLAPITAFCASLYIDMEDAPRCSAFLRCTDAL